MHSCIAIFLKSIRYALQYPTYHIQKVIKFELMEDPDSNDMFVGANDSCFQSTWDVCLGKEVKKGKGADLNDVELAANCLLNVLFIGRHPQGFDKDYKKLLK